MALLVQVQFDTAAQERGSEVVNTYHFERVGVTDNFGFLMDAVQDVYTLGVPAGGRLSDNLSAHILRGATASRTRIYDLDDTPPRLPVAERLWQLDPPQGSKRLPTEVAIVVTERVELQAGVSRGRQRGRIYFGPWQDNMNTISQTGPARPASGIITMLGEAMDRLRTSVLAGIDPYRLVVWSDGARDNSDQTIPYDERPLLPPLAFPVTHFEVGNSFDTQRRRGLLETSRTVFD